MPVPIGPIIKAASVAIPFVAGLFGNKDKSSAAGNDLIAPLLKGQNDIQEFGLGEARKFLPKAGTNLDRAGDFYSQLLSGDDAAVTTALAPQIGRVIDQYDTALQSARQLAPRGGGQAAINAEAPTRKAAAVSNLVSEQVAGAPAGLTSVGSAQGNLATGLLNAGGLTGANALNAISRNQQIELLRKQQRNEELGALAEGITSIITGIAGTGKDKS
jgi:hypothetical protein